MFTVTEPQDPLPGLQNSMVFGPGGGCIGRGQDNDWVLPDPLRYLSVHHARVRCYQGVYYIEDTSTNGVFLNGASRPLGKHPSPPLRDGDRLRMGSYELLVSISASDQEAANDSAEHEAAALSSDSVEALLIDHSNILPALTAPTEADPAPLPADHEPLPVDGLLPDRRRVPRAALGVSPEFDAFCRGAGIPATELPANSRLPALQLAGLMLREALVGARELAKSRREILRAAGLNPEAEESGRAALQRYSIEELLKQFLTAHDPTLPEAIPWLREVFSTARRNDAAFVTATRQALADFLRRLEPGALAAGGAAPDERFRALTDMPHDLLPALYVEALSRHFAALVAESR